MTVNMQTIKTALRNAVLSTGANTEVIFYFPNAPRPALPYTTINDVSLEPEIDDWTEFDTTFDANKSYGYRNILFSINTYGDNAMDEANRIIGGIRNQLVRDQFRADCNGTLLATEAPTNLTELLDSSYEKRATFDIIVSALLEDGSTQENTGYFDQVVYDWTNKPL